MSDAKQQATDNATASVVLTRPADHATLAERQQKIKAAGLGKLRASVADVERSDETKKLFRPAVKFLESCLISDTLKDKADTVHHRSKLVTLPPSTTVDDALTILSENDVLGAPVIEADDLNAKGFVDVLDLLVAVLKAVTKEPDDEKLQWCTYPRDILALTKQGSSILSTMTVQDVINASHVDPYCPVANHANLYQLVEGVFYKGIHRAPIVADNGKLLGIISQSDIMLKLAHGMRDQYELFGALCEKTIDELKLCQNSIVIMSEKAQAIHALFLMYYNKVSAVAIVDRFGHLVGNISASDLRGITRTGLGTVLLPVLTFLTTQQNTASHIIRHPMACKLTTKFSTLVTRLGLFRLHRLWVIDEDEKPIGVVSLTDILQMLARA